MIEEIINKINKIKNIKKYTEFSLNKYFSIDDIQNIISNLKRNSNNIVSYNSITESFNNIGVIDIDDKRYYDFDDDIWTLTNKGIDCSILA